MTISTIAEFEDAVAKLAAELGLDVAQTTRRRTDGKPTVVTVKLSTESDQLELFE